MRFLKADSQKSHPNIDFTISEWTIKNGIPMPTFAADYPALPELYNFLAVLAIKRKGFVVQLFALVIKIRFLSESIVTLVVYRSAQILVQIKIAAFVMTIVIVLTLLRVMQ